MEKLIIYAIGGVLYFIYKAWKKSQEDKKPVSRPVTNTAPATGNTPQAAKPIASQTLEEVMAEIKRKQALAEAQKKLATPVPTAQKVQTTYQKPAPKEIFIHEKKKATFGEGANDAPVYERELTESEKTVRGDIKLKNEGVYKVETMEEARALADNTDDSAYEFDAKQAFIGSVIFERKY